jgi:3'(2'), 5'-bisphosphate nucleotidase
MSLHKLLAPLAEISRNAGNAILQVYERADHAIVAKQDNSPLTAADMAAHHIIVAALQELTPDLPILSEESTPVPWSIRKQWPRYWLVDPLDGTREFIKRNDEFTVNIALIDSGVPVLGVVYVPALDVLYTGLQGEGAWKEEQSRRISISPAKIAAGQKQLRVVASRNHRGELLDEWLAGVMRMFPELELISLGSSLKICLVAEGKADIYARLTSTSEWDTAAAHAVLLAAGGRLMDTNFADYHYNRKESLLNPFFYAIGDKYFDFSMFNMRIGNSGSP